MTTRFEAIFAAILDERISARADQRARDAQIARECAERWAEEAKSAPHVEFMASAARIIAAKIESGE